MSAAAAAAADTRALYRALLRTAARFPSRKRLAILADIRAEFRAGASLAEPRAVAAARALAEEGLATMRKYTDLDPRARDWSVTLGQAPLGSGSGGGGGGGGGGAPAAPAYESFGSGSGGVSSL